MRWMGWDYPALCATPAQMVRDCLTWFQKRGALEHIKTLQGNT